MIEYEFSLHISSDEYLHYYQGVAKAVQVRTECGKLIQFSADKIRQFVLEDGVHGRFIIRLDNKHKFLSVRRIR